jgi:cobalt-precorrin 5A hydrolase
MKALTIGIGCRRLASAQQIDAAVRVALAGRPLNDVREVASLDSKAAEPGLVEFCARHALPLRTFTREQISAVGTLSTPSAAAREHLGIDGVCEPCALLASPGGTLIVTRIALNGVTVAIASAIESTDP